MPAATLWYREVAVEDEQVSQETEEALTADLDPAEAEGVATPEQEQLGDASRRNYL